MNKNNYRVLLLVFASLLFFYVGGNAYSQEKAVVEKEVKEFAQTSLEGYIKNVLTTKNVGNFGFRSLYEAQMAKVGDALPIMNIELKDLKAYKPGAGVKSLLSGEKTNWFPVTVEGEVRAKLEIIEIGGKLISGDFGARSEAQRLAAIRDQLPGLLKSKEIEKPNIQTLLKIPVLKAIFLYIESSQKEFLIPAMALPQRYDLQNGELYLAVEVLSRLSEYAKKIPEGLIR